MKLLISNLLKKFELKVEKNYNIKMAFELNYNVANPKIDIKLRAT